MKYRILTISIIVFALAENIHGQTLLTHNSIYDNGIFAEYGAGIFSMKDEYFSFEKYSGKMPYLSFGFSGFHNKYGSCLGLEYSRSARIMNNNISAEVINLSLFHDFQYPVGRFRLFSKDVFAYFGPSTEFYFFYNKQNYAASGIYFNYSIASLVSLGINSKLILPVSQRFQAESSVRLSLLSLGFRMPEVMSNENNEEAPVKLMTAFSSMNSSINIGLKYYIIRSVSMKLKYKLQVVRISAWGENIISAGDYITLTVLYHFKTKNSK